MTPSTSQGLGIVTRPPFQLRSLPIRFRWEATRRHPYYQDWWQPARKRNLESAPEDPIEELLQTAAVGILACIGVVGEPPDPALSFEELEADRLRPGWLSGAVQPITIRGLIGLLLALLPKATLAEIGYLFLKTGCEGRTMPRRTLYRRPSISWRSINRDWTSSWTSPSSASTRPRRAGRSARILERSGARRSARSLRTISQLFASLGSTRRLDRRQVRPHQGDDAH